MTKTTETQKPLVYIIQDMTSNTGRNYIDTFKKNCHIDNAMQFDNEADAVEYAKSIVAYKPDWYFIEAYEPPEHDKHLQHLKNEVAKFNESFGKDMK